MPEYLTNICLLHVDVVPVRPADYARNRHRPQSEVAATTGGPAVTGNLPPRRLRGYIDELSGTLLHSLAQSRWQR
jgi:hypothetical protein